MKILAPTDFSSSAYNALTWVQKYLCQVEGVAIEVMHCVELRKRADMFTRLDDLVRERAEHDLEILEKTFNSKGNSLTTTIFAANPKSFIPTRAKQLGADLIVIGSTGLNAVKEITFGSVADYVARFAETPVLIIPDGISFQKPESIILGMGTDFIFNPERFKFINTFLGFATPRVYLTQVTRKEPHSMFESELERMLDRFPVEAKYLQLHGSITQTLHLFADEVSADLICLMHQPRGWLGRILQPSITKEAFYQLKRPLLILPDQPLPTKSDR